MNYIPNSIEARDVASLVQMQTNQRKHQQEGPQVIVRGEGPMYIMTREIVPNTRRASTCRSRPQTHGTTSGRRSRR